MKKFTFFLASIWIFAGCRKENSIYYVKGTVYEEGTDIPVAGAKILIFKNPYDGNVDSAMTDSYGKYVIRYPRMAFSDYYVTCSADKYFNLNTAPKKLQKGKMAINFSLVPHGYLRIRYVKPTNVYKIADVQILYKKYPTISLCSCFPGTDYHSSFDITAKTVTVYGNGENKIEWGIADLSVSGPVIFSFSDNIFIPKGDTVYYTITIN